MNVLNSHGLDSIYNIFKLPFEIKFFKSKLPCLIEGDLCRIMATAQRYKLIDDTIKDTVRGFLRKEHKILFKSTDHYLFENIPLEIHQVVTLYFETEDYFTMIGRDVVPSINLQTITKVIEDMGYSGIGYGNTSLGDIIIPTAQNVICKWKLKINQGASYSIIIGIFSGNNYSNDSPFYLSSKGYENNRFYAYCNDGLICNHINPNFEKLGRSYSKDDNIKIILNTLENTVSFQVNEGQIRIDKIETGYNIKYRLAVTLGYKNDSVTISKFSKIPAK